MKKALLLPSYSVFKSPERSENKDVRKQLFAYNTLAKTLFGYNFMLPCSSQFYLHNQWTLKSEMYDDFLEVRDYGKLSAKFILGTSTVIEKVGLLSYF